MRAHTPGPWVIQVDEYGHVRIVAMHPEYRKEGLDYVLVDEVGGRRYGKDFSDESERHANAHLIAAAPELREALNEAYAWMETIQGELHRMEDGDRFDGAPLGLARSALAKAAGSSLRATIARLSHRFRMAKNSSYMPSTPLTRRTRRTSGPSKWATAATYGLPLGRKLIGSPTTRTEPLHETLPPNPDARRYRMNAPLKFFAFRQNNSGGVFDHDPALGIGINVFIQAVDAKHAEARAEIIGLYFNGCAGGTDCSCCGDRWSELWGDDANGSDEPMQYGYVWAPVEDGESSTLEPFFGVPSYIHYFDGTFKAATRVTP